MIILLSFLATFTRSEFEGTLSIHEMNLILVKISNIIENLFDFF